MKPPEQVKLVLATQWLAKADQDIKAAAALRQAAALTPYGVELHYPGEQSDPDIDEAERAVALAGVVRVAVLSIIPVD